MYVSVITHISSLKSGQYNISGIKDNNILTITDNDRVYNIKTNSSIIDLIISPESQSINISDNDISVYMNDMKINFIHDISPHIIPIGFYKVILTKNNNIIINGLNINYVAYTYSLNSNYNYLYNSGTKITLYNILIRGIVQICKTPETCDICYDENSIVFILHSNCKHKSCINCHDKLLNCHMCRTKLN